MATQEQIDKDTRKVVKVMVHHIVKGIFIVAGIATLVGLYILLFYVI